MGVGFIVRYHHDDTEDVGLCANASKGRTYGRKRSDDDFEAVVVEGAYRVKNRKQLLSSGTALGPAGDGSDAITRADRFAIVEEQVLAQGEAPDPVVVGNLVKLAWFDRIEWTVLPDPATAAAALRQGEVDWVERPPADLLPLLRDSRDVRVVTNDTTGQLPMILVNHLHPPFNNRRLLQAILPALNQADFVQAAMGAEFGRAHTNVGFFVPGSAMASDAGMEIMTRPRDLALAKRLIVESGYAGEKLVLMTAADAAEEHALGDVATDLFTRLGLNVDPISMDRGTLEARRGSREATEKGGWSAVCISFEGLHAGDPINHGPLRGNGAGAYFGWPTSPEIEAARDAWFETPDLVQQKQICEAIQRTAWEQVPYIPLGHWLLSTAMRTGLTAEVKASFPLFWNIRRGS